MEREKTWYYPQDRNCAQTDTAQSFDPQLPLGREAGNGVHTNCEGLVSPALMLIGNNRLRVTMMAPGAKTVEVRAHNKTISLRREEDGLWVGEIDCGPGGFFPVMFLVDGAEVINPTAPIGFGASRPINYADTPQQDVDFYLCKDVPHGAIAQDYYYSAACGCMRSCLVYTPPGYMKETSGEYPVLYLQHGHGENEQCWLHQGRMNFILDNLIAQGKAKPCVVVMNNGMAQRVDEDGLRVLDREIITRVLVEDCIPYIESHYRVKTDKWSRAMAGLSMGSFQTSVTTLSHPELFGYAGVFSGFVSMSRQLSGDGAHLKELDDKEKFLRDFKVFFRACGDRDLVALDRFRADSAMMQEKGLAPVPGGVHVEKFYPGEHEWNVWRMCLRDFIQLIF